MEDTCGERGLEEVAEFDFASRNAAVFEQAEIAGLLGSKIFRDEPGLEIFCDFLLTGLELGGAEGGFDKIDEVAARSSIGAAWCLLMAKTMDFPGPSLRSGASSRADSPAILSNSAIIFRLESSLVHWRSNSAGSAPLVPPA